MISSQLKMMFTMLLTRLVYMDSLVLPLPRWAALMTIVMTLKNRPPMMMRKYSTAASCVSSLLPARRIICGVKITKTAVSTAQSATVSQRAVRVISLASSWFLSPLRRATRADTAILTPKKTVSPMNFGWAVRPVAATA